MQFHGIQLQTTNEEWKMSWSISCTCLFTKGSREGSCDKPCSIHLQ